MPRKVMAPKVKVDVSGHTSRLRELQERKRVAAEELKVQRSQEKKDPLLSLCLEAMYSKTALIVLHLTHLPGTATTPSFDETQREALNG